MESRSLSLGQYTRILLRGLPLLLIVPIVAAAAGYFLADRLQSPHYVAEAQMLVTSPAFESSGPSAIRAANEIVPTYIDLGRSEVFLRDVSQSHDLGLTGAQMRKRLDFVNEDGSLLITLRGRHPTRDGAILMVNSVATDLAAREASIVRLAPAEDTQRLQNELSELAAKIQLNETEIERLTETFIAIPAPDTAGRARLVDQISVLRGNVQMWRSDYASTLDALRDISEVITLSVSKTADSARLVEGPSRQEAALTAGLVGLLLGTGLVFLMWYTDSRVRSREDVERLLHQPVLAETQARGRERGDRGDDSFQRLYSRVDAWRQGKASVVLAVACAPPQRSDLALKLARTAAAAGDSVVLVSSEPESSLVSWDQPRAGGGLAALCAKSDSPPDKYLSLSPFPGLRLISAATEKNAPTTLSGVKRAFRRLADAADLVVVDARPAEETPTLLMSGASDATILVVQADRTDAREAAALLDTLRSFGSNVMGVVLDRRKPEQDMRSAKRNLSRQKKKKEEASGRSRAVGDGVTR